MPAIEFSFHVEMEDNKSWDVSADQRDLSRYETTDYFGEVQRTHTFYRYMAWSASHRKGLTNLPWDEFNEKCVQVTDVDEGKDKVLDPTQPGQPG